MALSRALGDFQYKTSPGLSAEEQVVTGRYKFKYYLANPDISIHYISDSDEFVVIACDGKI